MAGLRRKHWSIALVALTAVAAALMFGRGFGSRKPPPLLPGPSTTERRTREPAVVGHGDDLIASFPGADANFAALLQRDPARAALLAVEANASFETALASWVRLNPRAAAAFAAGLQNPELRQRALSSVASAWLDLESAETV